MGEKSCEQTMPDLVFHLSITRFLASPLPISHSSNNAVKSVSWVERATHLSSGGSEVWPHEILTREFFIIHGEVKCPRHLHCINTTSQSLSPKSQNLKVVCIEVDPPESYWFATVADVLANKVEVIVVIHNVDKHTSKCLMFLNIHAKPQQTLPRSQQLLRSLWVHS